MTIDQNYLNYYFGNVWHKTNNPVANNNLTGFNLLENLSNDEWVIDVGCGTNPFKGRIKNLIGVDPAFEQADVKCTIEQFETDQLFDVAFCLGSINFGGRSDVENQIAKVVSLLKPRARIYWRCNPGQQDHQNEECKNIDFYPWSIEEHVRLSTKFGFNLTECCWEHNKRIYAVWVRI